MEHKLGSYRVRIFHFILKFVKDPVLAEDLTQDVLLKVWMRREKILSLEDMDSYVMAMSKNHVLDHFKKLAKEKEYQEEVWRRIEKSEDRIVGALAAKEIEAQLDSILRALPARQQEIFGLSRNEGLSFKEIAEKLEIAPNTAKNHLTRALKAVRSQIRPESFWGIVVLLLFL